MKKTLPILAILIASVMSAATPEEIIAKAEAGNLDAMAFASEKMRYGEKGWPKDKLKSDQFLRTAAEKGNPEGAVLYCIGTAVPAEQQEKMLRKAAESGHVRAFSSLARFLGEKYSKSQDERTKFKVESYAWAKLAQENEVNAYRRAEAVRTADRFAGYVAQARSDAANSKKSTSMSLGDSPERLTAKGQDAAKQLAERMKKKFPNGFPVWPPNFDDAPAAQPAK